MNVRSVHRSSLSRATAFRCLLVVICVCLASAFFSLATPTTHAASPSSSIVDMLKKAGYVQVKPHSVLPSAAHKQLPHVRSNASPGPYLFNDNIFSLGNSLYVSAELNYTGGNNAMLRARTHPSAIGPWEVFNWYAGSNGAWEIQSNANGLFVSAELNYTGGNNAMLRARTHPSAIGPWEQFDLFTSGGCDPVVFNCQAVILSVANNKLVAAELGYTGGSYAMLRARTDRNSPGPWETFDV